MWTVRATRKLAFTTAAATLALVSVVACTSPAASPKPTLTPPMSAPPAAPRLTGRLLVQAQDYSVWSISETGGAFTGRQLAPGKGVAALSPDLRTLAYVTGSDITFQNISTGTTRRQPITAGGKRVPVAGTDFGNPTSPTPTTFPACLSWAPDERHLLFLASDGSLYVTTPDGQAILVDQPQTAEYQTNNFSPFGSTFRSYVGCGAWLDARRFVFDRIGHGMPKYIPASSDLVPPDTTAVATVASSTVKVVNTGGQWRPDGVCGARLLITNIGANSATVVTDTGTDALTRPGGPPGTPLPPALAQGQFVARFVPGSCTVIVVDDGGIHRYDPTSTQSTTVAVTQPLDGAFLQAPADFAWRPGANPTVFAGSDLDPTGATLQLFDLATGGVAELLPGDTGNASLPDYKLPQQLRAILGWLPH